MLCPYAFPFCLADPVRAGLEGAPKNPFPSNTIGRADSRSSR